MPQSCSVINTPRFKVSKKIFCIDTGGTPGCRDDIFIYAQLQQLSFKEDAKLP